MDLTHHKSHAGNAAYRAGVAVIATAVGSALGYGMQLGFGGSPIASMLIGIGGALLAFGPNPARSAERIATRGLIVASAAVLASALFNAASPGFAAWAAAAASVLAGLGAADGSGRAGVTRNGLQVAGVALGFFVGWSAVEFLASTYMWSELALASLFGGVVGAGALAGRGLATLATDGPARALLGDARDGAFAHEVGGLVDAAARVEARLRAIEQGSPADAALVAHVRRAVEATLADARGAASRWDAAGADAAALRLIGMRRRLRDTERALASANDPRIAAEAERTLVAQRRAVAAVERSERARVAFSLRLEQARAQVELLEVQLQGAQTAGRSLDMAEVEGAVELLEEAQSFLESSNESATWDEATAFGARLAGPAVVDPVVAEAPASAPAWATSMQ